MVIQMYFWARDQFKGSIGSLVGVGMRALPKGSSLMVPISADELPWSVVIVGTRDVPFSTSLLGVVTERAVFSDMVRELKRTEV